MIKLTTFSDRLFLITLKHVGPKICHPRSQGVKRKVLKIWTLEEMSRSLKQLKSEKEFLQKEIDLEQRRKSSFKQIVSP